MTDRELLELAAKAAGKRVTGWNTAQGELVAVLEDGSFWQPLHRNRITDADGDAQRLAVKLHINIEVWNVDLLVRATIYIKDRGHGCFQERYTTDPYAATCRAIVRAAAEIGKGTKPFPTAEEIREEWT